MSRYRSLLLTAAGLIGVFASILGLDPGPWRTVLLLVAGLMLIVGATSWVIEKVGLESLWTVLPVCKRLGIVRLCPDGVAERELGRKIENAREIRCLFVSGINFFRRFKPVIVRALRHNRARIRALLAKEGSDFVREVEQAEAPSRSGQIGPELRQVENLLEEYLREAARDLPAGRSVGTVHIGRYNTEFRLSVLVCDQDYGRMTMVLAPKRALELPTLGLHETPGGLLANCIRHFETLWEIASDRNGVKRILVPATRAGQETS